MRVLVIIPSYNEQSSIRATVNELREQAPDVDILAVNDCSSDSTQAILTELKVRHLRLPVNLGIGGAQFKVSADGKVQLTKVGDKSAYGADVHTDFNAEYLKEFGLKPEEYYILVARLEPENNIVMAIEGYLHSKENGKRPLVVVGKTTTPHGKELVAKYGHEKGIKFVGGIYDFKKLDSVRHFSKAYFHGHSVGGTNPSLLEAMASGCFVLAHDNIFNRAVLKGNSLYYGSAEQVTEMLNDIDNICENYKQGYTDANIEEIKNEYSWEHLVDQHEQYFKELLERAKNK